MPSIIGIVSIGHDPSFFSERYFRDILTTASQEAMLHGYFIKILPLTREEGQDVTRAIERIRTQYLEALIVVAPGEPELPTITELFKIWPGVLLSPPRLDIPTNYLGSDNYGIMQDIVAHLVATRRRRILLLQPAELLTGDYAERRRGFLAAAAAYQIDAHIDEIAYPITADHAAQQILARPLDAVILPDDHYALALVSQLRRAQVRVPADIALVGFDDEDFARDMFPSLTTVSQPLMEMAQRATASLIAQLQSGIRTVVQEILPNTLIVRESTAVVKE